MDREKYRYSHMGIPTTKQSKNEKYIPAYDLYLTGYKENDFNIEWLRFGENCKLPEIIQRLPHIAFEVDDIQEALEGRETLVAPTTSSGGLIAAFILEGGVPIELLQIDAKQKI